LDAVRLAQVRTAAGELTVVNAATPEAALAEIADADAFFGKLTPPLLAAARRLDWVQSPTASLEHYLFPALIEHPCRLSNMRGLFSDVIAEHVFGFMLCAVRNLHLYIRQQRDHVWQAIGGEASRQSVLVGCGETSGIDRAHRTLADCTLGVVGVGAIGAEIGRRAAGFGMTIRGVDPRARSLPGVMDDIWPPERLPHLLGESDFVVIAAPHSPATEKLFRTPQFRQMRPHAWLINIGRGAIVDSDDLTLALQNKTIAGAALDVFETEPLPPDHPLWDMPNVILTPHIAAASTKVPRRHLETLLENVRRYARGDEPTNLVDKRLWF
jgi:phosphoglycerate dehydrogenase-like enzyme